jgi:hypothetical protein
MNIKAQIFSLELVFSVFGLAFAVGTGWQKNPEVEEAIPCEGMPLCFHE